MVENYFARRDDRLDIEEGLELAPRFDADGVLPAVATDAETGDVLMLAYMNADALKKTIESGEAHYWSRSRKEIWHKGATSGNVQKVVELRIDCDQDAVWMRVEVAGSGASCHVGYKSCFFRSIPVREVLVEGSKMRLAEEQKTFDPDKVYAQS
jgi:phosphoribosyl-AMP cyclohydrolase